MTALLGGHEALAYLAALRDGQILQENECEHYAAQIAEAGAAWETVLEGVSFEDLSRLRHLLREVDEHTKYGGELFNGFQHETERIPAHRLEELHQLGTALLGECPENDCTIYRNVFRMAVDVDGQMGKLTGHARETMQREYERLLRELNHLYTMNHAVKKYRRRSMTGLELLKAPETTAGEIADIISAPCPPTIPAHCDGVSCGNVG